jgi:hypothetical protein
MGFPPNGREHEPEWVLETHFAQFLVHTPKTYINGNKDKKKSQEKIGITNENRPKNPEIRHGYSD